MKEIYKLEEILKENNIKYERYIERNIYPQSDYDSRNQIVIRNQKEPELKVSCVCHMGSYGVEKGLIEFYDFCHEPIGYLTAKKAWKIIKIYLKEWD